MIDYMHEALPLVLQNPKIQEELSKISELTSLEEPIKIIIKALEDVKEKLAVEKYKEGKITLSQLKDILEVSEWEIDELLKKHNVFRKYEVF